MSSTPGLKAQALEVVKLSRRAQRRLVPRVLLPVVLPPIRLVPERVLARDAAVAGDARGEFGGGGCGTNHLKKFPGTLRRSAPQKQAA